jgi:hypothetical protein
MMRPDARPCKALQIQGFKGLGEPKVNGEKMRGSAPLTTTMVASWSHPSGSKRGGHRDPLVPARRLLAAVWAFRAPVLGALGDAAAFAFGLVILWFLLGWAKAAIRP